MPVEDWERTPRPHADMHWRTRIGAKGFRSTQSGAYHVLLVSQMPRIVAPRCRFLDLRDYHVLSTCTVQPRGPFGRTEVSALVVARAILRSSKGTLGCSA